MHYVYLLKLANGDIYKGRTDDLKRRYIEHVRGKVKSTAHYRPLILVGYEAYVSKCDAIRREKFLKTSDGSKLLKQQYKDAINNPCGEVPERSNGATC